MRTRDVAIGGELLRGRRDLLKLHRAQAPQRRVDARYFAGHSHAEDAVAGQVLVGLAIAHVHVGARLHRRGFAVIKRVEGVGLRHIDEHEAAAADSARRGIGDAYSQRGRDGSVHRVTALLENLDAGARGVLALGHDHAMDADGRRV